MVERRPIGYWLKELDRLLEEDFGRLLAAEGIGRRHWQVLNTVAAGPVSLAEVEAALAPFRSGAGPSVVVGELRARGWVRQDGAGAVELTAEGVAAHAELGERVRANRLRVTEGISAQEYRTTVDVLERMAANLAR